MKSLRITLLAIVILSLVGAFVGSAQAAGALVRFGIFTNDLVEVDILTSSGLSYPNMPPNLMTSYTSIEAGEHTVEYVVSGDNAPSEGTVLPDTIILEAGHQYMVIKTSFDQDALMIDETVLDEEAPLAEGENSLIIVTQAATGEGDRLESFRFTDSEPTALSPRLRVPALAGESFRGSVNAAPPAQDRPLLEFHGYMRTGIGLNARGGDLERLDPQTQETDYQINIPYLPNTNVVINGDTSPDGDVPIILNFSTNLSVADWLAQVNQMPNPPFTFNHFLEMANTGGFTAALVECPFYMWTPWTDAAFEALSPELQAYVRGAGAATVINNSVVEEAATTTPWSNAPTTTRGGIPISFVAPVQLTANGSPPAAEGNGVNANILLTVTTTGNDVQNVINILDTLPIGDEDAPPSGIEYRFHSDIDEAFIGG